MDDYGKDFSYPTFMIILHSSCNANCTYCFSNKKENFISIDLWEKVLLFLKAITKNWDNSKPIKIIFHGGEPLLIGFERFNLYVSKLVHVLKDKQLELSIQSNLLNLDNNFIELFKKYKISVGTSLDGPEFVTDAQRGKHYFARNWRAIQQLRENGIPVGCIVTFTSFSSNYWKEILDFFKNNQIPININCCVKSLGHNTQSNDLIIKPEDYLLLLKKIWQYYLQNYKHLHITTITDYLQFVLENKITNCMMGNCLGKFLVIDSDGGLYTCERFAGLEDYCLGNVEDFLEQFTHEDKICWNSIISGNSTYLKLCDRFERLENRVKEFPDNLKKYQMGGCIYQALTYDKEGIVDPYWEKLKLFFREIEREFIKETIDYLELKQKGNNLWTFYEFTRKFTTEFPLITLKAINYSASKATINAKRIVAAYLLALYNDDMNQVNTILNNYNLVKNFNSGLKSLESFTKRLFFRQITNLYVDITWNCNLQCIYCYASAPRNVNLDIDNFRRLIFELEDLNFKKIIITGGEPLLHPKFDEILNIIKKAKTSNNISTDFVLSTNWCIEISRSLMREVLETFDEIRISIEGYKERHERIRGIGTYEKVINNLKKLAQLKIKLLEDLGKNEDNIIPNIAKIRISCLTEKGDEAQELYEELYNLASSLKLDTQIRLIPIKPLGRGKNVISFDHEEYPDFISYFKNTLLRKSYASYCGLGNSLSIDPLGNIYPCVALYETEDACLGNIKDKRLKEVLESRKFKIFKEYSVNSNKFCKKCKVKYICGGGCQAFHTLKSIKYLNKKPDFCNGEASSYFYRYALKKLLVSMGYLSVEKDIINVER